MASTVHRIRAQECSVDRRWMLWQIVAFPPPGFWSLTLDPSSSILVAQVYLPASSRVPRESMEAVVLMVHIILRFILAMANHCILC